jgi:hypothetical protein
MSQLEWRRSLIEKIISTYNQRQQAATTTTSDALRYRA